jgi:microcystin-dependent protein
MSSRSSFFQRFLPNTLFGNTTIAINTSDPTSPASIAYVDAEIAPINTEITSLNNSVSNFQTQLTSLQNQVDTLKGQVTTLEQDTQRVVGSIIMTPSTTAPPYTLPCNGAAVSKTTYAELYAVIGFAYGNQGANFLLPDFRSNFPLGGNGTTLGVASSNLATGNGYSGATNTQQIYGSSYFGLNVPSFPIMTTLPVHAHGITDNGHQHYVGDVGTIGFGVDSTDFLSTGLSIQNPANTDLAATGITINNTGTNIQTTDPISGISGVNICPPYIAMNFYITYQ